MAKVELGHQTDIPQKNFAAQPINLLYITQNLVRQPLQAIFLWRSRYTSAKQRANSEGLFLFAICEAATS